MSWPPDEVNGMAQVIERKNLTLIVTVAVAAAAVVYFGALFLIAR